jgi:hypothetical protein
MTTLQGSAPIPAFMARSIAVGSAAVIARASRKREHRSARRSTMTTGDGARLPVRAVTAARTISLRLCLPSNSEAVPVGAERP